MRQIFRNLHPDNMLLGADGNIQFTYQVNRGVARKRRTRAQARWESPRASADEADDDRQFLYGYAAPGEFERVCESPD